METKVMTEFKYSEVEPIGAHFHNSYEVMFVVDGEAVVTVGESVYRVGADTLVFFSNLEEHHTEIVAAPFCRYFIKLDPVQLNLHFGSMWQTSVFKNRSPGFIHWIDVRSCSQTMHDLFRMLGEEYEKDDEFTDDIVISIFRQILILSSRVAPDRFDFNGSEELKNCAKLQMWIEQHFREDIRIRDLTVGVPINPQQLSQSFKKATGYTPKQYMMLNRVALAKELLIHTDGSVNEIANQSGFQDTSNFIRYFKQEQGVTPNEYRRNNKQEQ